MTVDSATMCREFDSHRLHTYLSFASVRADDVMNGYFGRLTYVTLPTELRGQVNK